MVAEGHVVTFHDGGVEFCARAVGVVPHAAGAGNDENCDGTEQGVCP